MPRVKIDIPENFFSIDIKIPVRITDINYGHHVGNDSLVSIVHEGRMQFLQHHGYTELNIEGIGLIMADLAMEFKNESFYRDIIDVQISATSISRVSFELIYKLSCIRNDEEIIIALAKTTMVCYHYDIKKVSPVPAKLKAILTG